MATSDRIVLFAVAFLLTSIHPVEAQRPVFSSGVDLVTVGVSVLDDDGEPVSSLGAADIEIYEDGELQEIRYFAKGVHADADQVPLHVGVLFDASDSMGEDSRFAKTAAIRFLSAMTSAEDITLVDFDTEIRVGRYSQADFPRLVERLRRRGSGGFTAFYDALGVYLDGAFGQDGRKVLLVYSDGEDSRSDMRFSDVLDLLRASDVTVYAIAFHEHLRPASRVRPRRRLDELTSTTGGRTFFPRRLDELEAIYGEIATELENRYTVGYVSTNPRDDGAWRRREVVLSERVQDHDRLTIRTRDGYYARYRDSRAPER